MKKADISSIVNEEVSKIRTIVEQEVNEYIVNERLDFNKVFRTAKSKGLLLHYYGKTLPAQPIKKFLNATANEILIIDPNDIDENKDLLDIYEYLEKNFTQTNSANLGDHDLFFDSNLMVCNYIEYGLNTYAVTANSKLNESLNEAAFKYDSGDYEEVETLFTKITGRPATDLDNNMFSRSGGSADGDGEGWMLNIDDTNISASDKTLFVKSVMRLGKLRGWKIKQYGDDAVEIYEKESVNEDLGNGVADLSQKEVRDLKTKINNASTIGKFFTSEEKEFLMSLIEPTINEAAAPKFTAKEFVAYVNDEFDSETIELMQNVLGERLKFLDKMKSIANPRTVVQGYMRKDDLKESLGRYAIKLDEGAFSDLDVLADESSDFNEFLGKVQQDYPQVKTTDPTFKDFLKKLFDAQDTMGEITKNPMDSSVFHTIWEVAEINGFNNKITKNFKTSTALVLHISKQLSDENRRDFMRDVREIKNAFNFQEFIL